MPIASLIYLSARVLHVLFAAVWVGATAFIYVILMPALEQLGPTSDSVLIALTRQRIHVFIGIIGGITVLTGLWLLWRFTGGFDPAASGTVASRVFSTGGLAGIIALIIGGSVVGRGMRKMTDLATRMKAAGVAEHASLAAQAAAVRRRTSTAGKIVLALQIVALVCMAIGHYI